jgi:hypothetical protein
MAQRRKPLGQRAIRLTAERCKTGAKSRPHKDAGPLCRNGPHTLLRVGALSLKALYGTIKKEAPWKVLI